MAESSDDPLSILPKLGLTPLRKAIPQQRRSNPLYIPTDERYGSMKEDEESSDPTLLKPAPRATPANGRVLLQGINPRTPQIATESKEKRWVTVKDVKPAEEDNGDVTVRPNITEDGQNGDTSVVQDDTTLDEDAEMRDFWNLDAPARDSEMNHDVNDEEGLHSQMREQDEDYLEGEDMDLIISEGGFQPHTSDDELAFHLKSDDEQDEIREEIKELLEKIPELGKNYELVDRLGTGTFSSVFKAIDLNYDTWDNRLWEGPQSSQESDPNSPEDRPQKHAYVAIKRIIVTSSPRRILNELKIMETCRGCRHVAQLITAYRVEDQIVAVMPYQRSVELKDLMRGLDVCGVRQYFRCMFRALRDIHSRGIIHRDLKPANFLFDPIENTGTMVDFGLAEEFIFHEDRDTGCMHTAPTFDALHGDMKDRQKWTNARRKSIKNSREKSELPPESIGWPTDDTRPVLKANRAGTRGFRAPEVLFKCLFQSPAIDIWSAGTILLFFLSGKMPIFTASSDMHALLEQALILGKATMEECAALHCRTFATNIPEIQDRTSWTDFVKRLNPDLLSEEPVPPSSSRHNEDVEEAKGRRLLTEACDLLERCLEPFSVNRITAREALQHPFLAPDIEELMAAEANPDGRIELDEDELFPHPPGFGVCEIHHHRSTKNDEWFVFVGYDGTGKEDWEPIKAGQGQAIGTKPCEFHEGFFYN